MSEHTPGPWEYVPVGCIYALCQLDKNGMTTESPIAEIGDGREEDYEANALLISAAPEMLEALEEVLPQIRWANIHGSRCEELIAQVESAIAKAKGESKPLATSEGKSE